MPTKATPHTPAPWVLEENGRVCLILTDNTGGTGHERKIAELPGRGEEDLANAFLFTAAPDLLEVAKLAQDYFIAIKERSAEDQYVLDSLFTAIAKADGRA